MPGQDRDDRLGITARADAEEQAAMLAAMAGRIRQGAGLELSPDHTTRLPTVWVFRLIYLVLGMASTAGVLLLNFKYLSRDEADKMFVKREVFDELRANTKQTADAVTAINVSIDQMRQTLATLAAKAEKDLLQDDRIRRTEERIDRINSQVTSGKQ